MGCRQLFCSEAGSSREPGAAGGSPGKKGKAMDREEQFIQSVKYSDVTRALSRDYYRLFCVNTNTHVYVEYAPHERDKALDIRTMGKDFREVVKSLVASAAPPDLDMVRTAFTRANVLKVLETDDSFSLNYRTLTDGKPSYVRLKATRLRKEDPSHLLFGLSNTDAHMQRLAIYERAISQQLTFSAVSEALAADYDCILYVNTDTAEFIEYSSSENYKKLGFTSDGKDFFEMCQSDFSRVVYEEDRDIFLRAFEKENLLKVLSADRTFLLTFRLVTDGAPYYVRVKVTKMSHVQDHHIVVGLSNIDASMQRVQQYEQMRAIANRDSLTGVKSKHAYTEDESRIDREISHSGTAPFAVAVCDVNGLKRINDSLGHQAGDDYLRRSSKMICGIFSHSPVYRIGGDEFVVLMTGSDYENRIELMKTLHRLSAAHIGSDEAVVSGGMSEYRPGEDRGIRDAFERADALMYTEKMLLKSEGAAVREDETDQPAQEPEEIPVINLRKHILIADDLQANREILGCLLEEDYDILYASDGAETMAMLRKHKDEIALLLLDLYMPEMTGREVMREMQVDEELMSIPVIMLTVDKDAELDSLKIGAMDFISKPYPDINIVKARLEERFHNDRGHAIVVISEGAKPKDGQQIFTKSNEPGYENVKLGGIGVKFIEQMKAAGFEHDMRETTLGHLQRGGVPIAYDRVLAAQFGVKAFEMVLNKEYGHMVAYHHPNVISVPIKDAVAKMNFVEADSDLVRTAKGLNISLGV